jgi:hypothetical protein
MAKKRAERVKEKLKKQREALQNIKKVNKLERPPKQKPIVNPYNTALYINNRKLKAMAEQLVKDMEFKEQNKDKLDEHFAKVKAEQAKIAEEFHVDAE